MMMRTIIIGVIGRQEAKLFLFYSRYEQNDRKCWNFRVVHTNGALLELLIYDANLLPTDRPAAVTCKCVTVIALVITTLEQLTSSVTWSGEPKLQLPEVKGDPQKSKVHRKNTRIILLLHSVHIQRINFTAATENLHLEPSPSSSDCDATVRICRASKSKQLRAAPPSRPFIGNKLCTESQEYFIPQSTTTTLDSCSVSACRCDI